MAKKILTIEAIGDRRFKQWTKVVTWVEKSKTNGYAFTGEFVKTNQQIELEVPCLLLMFGMEGSRKNASPTVEVRRIDAEGKMHDELYAEGSDWALKLRDDTAELINKMNAEKLEKPQPTDRLETLERALDYMRERFPEFEIIVRKKV